MLMEQVRSVWVVRNGVSGASVALGMCAAFLSHGAWPQVFSLSTSVVELLCGPFLCTSWTLVLLHGARCTEDVLMPFTREEKQERAFSSRGPLGFVVVAMLSGVGFALSAACVNMLDNKEETRAARAPSPALVSFVW
jgi:hypothetical protein